MRDNGVELAQDVQDVVGGLHAGRGPAGDAHGAAGDHGGREERDRVREIGFDVPVPGRDRTGPHLPAVADGVVDVDAGLPQHRHRHRDVRRRRQRRTGVLHGQALGEGRPGQQQAGHELR